MRAILIDDQFSQRSSLRELLHSHFPEIELVGEADGVKSGIALIDSANPDLVFLDIEMSDGTGFDVLERVNTTSFSVVFVTGHNEYAIKAFKYSAIDYVLKPIDPADLIQAVEKAKKIQNTQGHELRIQNLLTSSPLISHKQPEKIVLSDAECIYLVELKEIIRCQAESNYTRFFLTENRELLVSKTMKEYEQLLEGDSFFRVHQSHMINLNHFSRLDKRDGGTIVLKDSTSVPVAVRRKDELLARLRLI